MAETLKQVIDRVTQRNIRRSVICTCGWGGVFPEISPAQSAIDRHFEEGSEGVDHAVNIEDAALKRAAEAK